MGYSPLKSGLAFLPTSLTIGLSAILAPRLLKKVGYKPILVVAPLLLASGLFIFAHVPVAGEYVRDVLPGLFMIAVGLGFTFVAISVAATSGVPRQESGLVSGMLSTAQQVGGSLGLAILTSVASTQIATSLQRSDHSPLAQVTATVDGFHAAFYTGMIFALAASLIALLFIRRIVPGAEVLPRQ